MASFASGALRLWAVLAFAAGLTAAASGSALGQTRLCNDLKERLATLPPSSSSADIGQYDQAIRTQRGELRKARDAARRARCGFAVESADIDRCASINAAVGRMQENLSDLRRRRENVSGLDDPDRVRTHILAELDANGCGGEEKAERRLPRAIDGRTGREIEPDGDGLGPPLGQRRFVPGAAPDDDILRIPDYRAMPGSGFRGGRYRTLCVRMCDGYFFPISYAVPPDAFTHDERMCQSRCPGTDVELYVHEVPGGDAEEMVSVHTGEAYTRLPNAFLYRETDRDAPPGCGCDEPRNFSIIGGETGPGRDLYEEPEAPAPARRENEGQNIPLPLSRPDPAADPETAANRHGGLDRAAIERLLTNSPERTTGGKSGVRVVGPGFFPDREEATGPQARDPSPAR